MVYNSNTSGYLNVALDGKTCRKAAREVIATIRAHKVKFKYVAVRGMSGALVGGVVAAALGKLMIIVRKGESSHGNQLEIGGYESVEDGYIIIDDFISTGETVIKIISTIGKGYPDLKCTGIFCYSRFYRPPKEADCFIYKEHQSSLTKDILVYGTLPA